MKTEPLKSNSEFNFVDAVYREETDPAYASNPWVEALPALFSLTELQKKLAYLPKVSDEHRNASPEKRIVRLGELNQACIPLPRVVEFAQSVQKLLFEGYRNRCPLTPADRMNTQRLYEAQQSGRLTAPGPNRDASQLSMSLIGTPGSGKSFILQRISALFPKLIYHPELGRWQIPFLFIEMPYDGASVYTLASQIFLALERLMPGSDYFRTYVEARSINAERLCMKALNVAYELGVGMIVVDEAQNKRTVGNPVVERRRSSLTSATTARAKENGLRKLLITASNVGHMPLLFTGTMELQPTIAERASFARRKAGRGSATWEPLTREEQEGTSEFDIFMQVLFTMQWMPASVKYNLDWSDLFFEHTQGIPDLMVKLFASSQVRAIRANARSLTAEHVLTALDEFRTVEPILQGLGNRDEASLVNLTDVFGLEPIELRQPRPAPLAGREKNSARKPSASEVLELIDVKIEAPKRRSPKKGSKTGPVPVQVDAGTFAGADLRNAPPIAESPLAPRD